MIQALTDRRSAPSARGSRRACVLALTVTSTLILVTASTAAAVTTHGSARHRSDSTGSCASSPPVPFFADDVEQQPVAAPDGLFPLHYTFTAAVHFTHRFSSSWPPVKTLAYSTANAPMDYDGPTIVTHRFQPVSVTMVNIPGLS